MSAHKQILGANEKTADLWNECNNANEAKIAQQWQHYSWYQCELCHCVNKSFWTWPKMWHKN